MRFSLISVGVNIALGVTLFYLVGFWGIAAATSIAAWITVLQMWFALQKRGVYRPSATALFKVGRVAAASALLGILLAVAVHFRPQLEAPIVAAGLPAKELVVLLLSAAGLALYPVLLFAFGGVSPAEAKALLRRRRGDPAPPADLL
jgi:putative peptidoglycan lipid II flippase